MLEMSERKGDAWGARMITLEERYRATVPIAHTLDVTNAGDRGRALPPGKGGLGSHQSPRALFGFMSGR